jgi:hypothetical protein
LKFHDWACKILSCGPEQGPHFFKPNYKNMSIEHKSQRHVPPDGTISAASQIGTENPPISRLRSIANAAVAEGFTSSWIPEAQHALQTYIEGVLTATENKCNSKWGDVALRKGGPCALAINDEEPFMQVFVPESLVQDYQVDSRMAPKGIRAALEQSLLLLQHNVTTFAELREKQNKKGLSDMPGSRRRTVQSRRGGYLY